MRFSNLPTLCIVGSVSLTLACASAPPGTTNAPDARPSNNASRCIDDANVDAAVPANAPPKVTVRHILVRHAELRDPRGATRTRIEACEYALQALRALESGNVAWSVAVSDYSDAKDDSLGRVAPDELNPKFAAAAFALEVDQLSYVVETDRGFHVIWRER